jgi:hypothetical protein
MKTKKSILCKIGIHKNREIGRALFPYDVSKEIIAFGCNRCGKKSKNGLLVPKS